MNVVGWLYRMIFRARVSRRLDEADELLLREADY